MMVLVIETAQKPVYDFFGKLDYRVQDSYESNDEI